jgi:tRNA G18 (ribose-2'-O)-methylase SpoU
MLLEVVVPEEPFNNLVRKGTAGETIKKILDATKPEAAYFTDHHGHRSALLVVDVPEASSIPLGKVLASGNPSKTDRRMTENLTSFADSRLAPYRNLKDRELARLGGRFIAESDLVVRRLLASDFAVESVLVAQRKADALAGVVPEHVPLYVLPEKELDAVIGYPFHTGVLAVGLRKPPISLNEIVPKNPARSTLVICPDLTNHENLGSLIRISSAFGADAIILGERCCDPFYRLCIRVSMGTIFSLPIVQCTDVLKDMADLKTQHGYQLAASVLDPDAENLNHAPRPDRFAILFGNEATGLSAEHVTACDRRITLPMQRGTDSLNVAVAAGIFLYQFTRG